MKKIIKSKLYDTETAKEVGYYCNGLTTSDFGYVEETLYRKKTKEFFLYASGGAMSKYGASCGKQSYGTTNIYPLTVESAKEWAEEHMDADAYMEIFGTVEE